VLSCFLTAALRSNTLKKSKNGIFLVADDELRVAWLAGVVLAGFCGRRFDLGNFRFQLFGGDVVFWLDVS